jgi:hypothetical protein
VLEQYQDMPSFRGIQEDCEKIVDQLRVKLRVMLADDKVSLLCYRMYSSDRLCLL